jgi:hypothetical protein
MPLRCSALAVLLISRLAAGQSVDPWLPSSPTNPGVDGAAPATDEVPDRRGMPAPLDSPPFPSSDWVGPVIGTRSPQLEWPLEKWLDRLLGGRLARSHLHIYGWIDPSINGSTSTQSNIPLSYAIVPNHVELDQAVLRVERPLDTLQTDHVDWGFRFSSLYGIDYRFTTAKGWLSDQLLQHNALYGYDPVELYAQLYIPKVLDGLVITAGRYISPPDIEAQLAPDNYLFTHSLMFTFDPYTFTGANAQLQIDRQLVVQLGLHAGADMAPWVDSAQPNAEILVRYTATDNNDSLWGGLDSVGAGQFKDQHDDMQVAIATWGHRFNARFHMMTEGYYLWEYNAVMGGTCVDGPSKSYASGGGCGAPLAGKSTAIGLVNYFLIKLASDEYVAIRNDFLDDPRGWRTGFATWYTSHTLGWVHQFNSLFMIRPEIRYERSYGTGVTPYDNGSKKDQFIASADAVIRF